MAQIQDKIVKSRNQPNNTNVTWIDTSQNPAVTKNFINGTWVIVGGGGSGTSDYSSLSNKPSINGVELDGDKTTEELDITVIPIVEITYEKLKQLRDDGELIPGTWYRITDYTCTTTLENTQSAGHVFDIIVMANDERYLNENAYAAHHTGDTYFHNCKLETWELKYCLDNDTNRFAWADDENGTGVIFYMKDEWNNECSYDFKNIQFKRWAVSDSMQGREGLDGKYMGALNFILPEGMSISNENDFIWAYTFSSYADGSEDQVDYSLDGTHNVYDNVINDTPGSIITGLNNIVFFGENNNGNRFGVNCNSNTFGNDCNSNTFESDCFNNTFGNGCLNNTFGNSCYQSTFGNNCSNNTFGNNCSNNTFGNSYTDNTLGNYFQSNSFGNNCKTSIFGNNCNSNTFGNSCIDNTFGNNINYNTFGNDCVGNTFGSSCGGNIFGNYYQSTTVFDGVQNCSVTGGSQSSPVKNAQILNGTMGTSQNKLTITFDANKDYTQVAAKTTNGTLKIFNPADLVS